MEPFGNETLRGAFHGWLAIVYIIALVSAGIILILVIFRRRERGNRIDIVKIYIFVLQTFP